MHINTFLEAVAATVQSRVQGLKTCEPHGGRFDGEELKRLAVKAPAVLPACLGIVDSQDVGDGRVDAELELAAFVLARTRPGSPRAEAVRDLVEYLVLLLGCQRWGVPPEIHVGVPDSVRARNLYGGALDKQSVALWAVTWRQKVRLGEPEPEGILPEFVFASWEPDIGAPHEPEYEEVTRG